MTAMIVRVIGLLILITLNKLTLAEEYDTIRAEEETRHKEVLGQYVKASIKGALSNLFPRVTNQEQIEAEKWIAESNQFFDPPLPDTNELLDAKICKVHRERGKKILGYIRKRFPTHLVTQISVRIAVDSIGKQNDVYCRDNESRSHYVKNASAFNQHLNEINVARNKLIDNNLLIVYGNHTTKNLPILCCSYWAYKASILNSISTPVVKQFISEGLAKYNGNAIKYLCLYHSEGSQACSNLIIPPLHQNVTRFSSAVYAIVESISRITHIAL